MNNNHCCISVNELCFIYKCISHSPNMLLFVRVNGNWFPKKIRVHKYNMKWTWFLCIFIKLILWDTSLRIVAFIKIIKRHSDCFAVNVSLTLISPGGWWGRCKINFPKGEGREGVEKISCRVPTGARPEPGTYRVLGENPQLHTTEVV